uniref:Cadherin domain-containing protein n=1 Tax=Erpetoichthys calabaricus TaxID=27687 RepID=A0A8C4SHG5_ERPCA
MLIDRKSYPANMLLLCIVLYIINYIISSTLRNISDYYDLLCQKSIFFTLRMKRSCDLKRIFILSGFLMCIWKNAFAKLRYSLQEESIPGTIIGNIIKDMGLDLKDVDGRGFRLISGSKQQLLQVNHKTGALFVNEIIDREVLCDKEKPCFLDIKIVIENPLEIHQAEIEILDMNDHSPVFLEKTKILEISESTPVGSRFTLEGAYDPDYGVNSLKSYELSDNINFLLQVKEGSNKDKIPVLTGALFVNEIIDREVLCDKEKPCFLNIKVVIENPLEIHQAEIEILDINDNSPVFQEKTRIVEISESMPVGSRFTLDGAYDPDYGVNSLKFYELSENTHFLLQVKEGTKKDRIPVLVLQKALDRELTARYEFTLAAVDGGNPPRSANMNITVMIADVNDNVPIFDKDIYSVTLEENCSIGSLVLKLNASDLDEGSNREIIYSFDGAVKNNVEGLFELDIYSGEITVKGLIDFEEKTFYEFQVKATDRGPVPMSSECSVLIEIKDMNDNAPFIEVTSLTSSISEDVKPGTTIGLISITDLDSGVNSKISCTLSHNLPFELATSFQENLYSLKTISKLDRETVNQYNITLLGFFFFIKTNQEVFQKVYLCGFFGCVNLLLLFSSIVKFYYFSSLRSIS